MISLYEIACCIIVSVNGGDVELLDIRGLDILISKGDTEDLVICFEDDVPPDNTTVLMSLKRYPNNNQPLWEKSAVVEKGEFRIHFSSSDTNFSSGIYKWDMELIYEDGAMYHPMTPAKFQIVEVVTSYGLQSNDIATGVSSGFSSSSNGHENDRLIDNRYVKRMRIRINHAHTVYEVYSDDPENYVVVSDTDEDKVLETKWKVMADDITVKKIPYYDTVNPEGGRTIYIGKEMNPNG